MKELIIMMSTEENKAIIRRYIEEAWNKGNVNIIDQVMADNAAEILATEACSCVSSSIVSASVIG